MSVKTNENKNFSKTEGQMENRGAYVIDHSVEIRNGQYGKWDYRKNEAPRFISLGAAVFLRSISINANTSERILTLAFKDAHGKEVLCQFERKNLTETGIMQLLGKGVQVTKKTAGVLITSILNQEPDAPSEIRHTELGFGYFDEKQVFFGYTANGIESNYNGNLLIQPTGSFGAWKEMVQTEVLGTNLETIVAIAAAAPVIDFLKEEIHTGNIIASLVAESSTGKTTAGCLAVSLGSKCSFAGDSMVTTFADSKNSLMRSIYSSYPMLIDEGSLIRYNPTSLIYELAEGKEKGRLNKELEKADARTFSTAILMTSEKSILNLCDENTGLYVRCLEFENVVWTSSAESADNIKKVCERNYGFAIPLIAEHLLTTDRDELIERFWDYQKKIVEHVRTREKNTPLTERISKSVAMILLAADVFVEATDIELDVPRISTFVVENTMISEEKMLDIGQRALEYLRQYIAVNDFKFVKGKADTNEWTAVPPDCKGRLQNIRPKLLPDGKRAMQEVLLPEIVFEEILVMGGFPDKKVVLKKLKEAGYLACDKDRYLSRFIIAEPPAVKGYRIYLTEEIDFVSLEEEEAKGVEQIFAKGGNQNEEEKV